MGKRYYVFFNCSKNNYKKNYEKINKYFYISKYSPNLKKENIIEIKQKIDFLVSYFNNELKLFTFSLNILLLMRQCVHIKEIFV